MDAFPRYPSIVIAPELVSKMDESNHKRTENVHNGMRAACLSESCSCRSPVLPSLPFGTLSMCSIFALADEFQQ
jgi:hypothetical protein